MVMLLFVSVPPGQRRFVRILPGILRRIIMVYVFLADGFEEIEALTVVDLLRRAGIKLNTVSVTGDKAVTGRSDITVMADMTIDKVNWNEAAGIVLPGGMPGTTNLGNTKVLMNHVDEIAGSNDNRFIAAICAAPALLLGERSLLLGKCATCYPGMENHFIGATALTDKVVVDGNIITSRGLGTAIPFSLAIIEKLINKEKADEIAASVVY